ncbi:Protein-lysine N-methyltransferase efm4 [Marasmius tenuissimus]|nr:Protein-lysine N-methyltransferase efm4 [Marasmius tenuissimus]
MKPAPEIRVYETKKEAERRNARLAGKEKPDHWVTKKGDMFTNPWPSFIPYSWRESSSWYNLFTKQPPPPSSSLVEDLVPVVKPTWGASDSDDLNKDKVKATWLGHACFLVELPSVLLLSRGPRILFDPVFSDRCSPSQYAGPKRYNPPPCKIEDIPDVDAIVISVSSHSVHVISRYSNESVYPFSITTTISAFLLHTRQPHKTLKLFTL